MVEEGEEEMLTPPATYRLLPAVPSEPLSGPV